MEFDESKVLNISSSVTMATITDLFPATRYRFRVAAMTEFGQGEEVIVLQSTAPANGGTVRSVIKCHMHCMPHIKP